jgi:4'-phosphopantetheinyl transferase
MVGDSSTAWRPATNAIGAAGRALGRDEVRVAYAFTDRLAEPFRAAAALLSDGERARCRRLLFEEDRVSFVAGHALLRRALSEVAAVDPRRWRFTAPVPGRPEIEAPAAHRGLRFSLSHTAGLVACAVARERDVGVDVERVAARTGSAALAERCFSPYERSRMAGLPPAGAQALFFGLWTLKEAYAKARGLGLRLPLDAASFELAPGAPPVVSFPQGHGEDPGSWRFALLEPGPGYRLAVAARAPAGADVRITALAWTAQGT